MLDRCISTFELNFGIYVCDCNFDCQCDFSVDCFLSKNLSSSSISGESLSITPNGAPTSFPTFDITTLLSYKPSLKPSTQSDMEYIAMQLGVLEQIYIETDGDNSDVMTFIC